MPAKLVFEFDVYHPQGAEEDYQRAWTRLNEEGAPDILWTPLNGGHWLPIRGEDIQHFFRDWEHLSTALEEEAWSASMLKISEYMARQVRQRRLRPPGGDRLSRLVHARINGRLLNEDELKGICSLLLIGGLDTVASMIGFVMHFLARSPSHRRQLTDSPALIPRAIDEFLRRFGLTIPGRIVRRDFSGRPVGCPHR